MTHWSHDSCLPAELFSNMSVNYSCSKERVEDQPGLTRSSPCGPAEHDEGGSLGFRSATPFAQNLQAYQITKYTRSFVAMKYKTCHLAYGTGEWRHHSPAEICEFFVDSLQSHGSEWVKGGEIRRRRYLRGPTALKLAGIQANQSASDNVGAVVSRCNEHTASYLLLCGYVGAMWAA